jgi:hypothetical protein
LRAAFYYPWYPEQWTAAGHRYTPYLGLYDSGDPAVIDAHIGGMKYANIEAGLYSWWGKNSPTDSRLGLALDRAEAAGFKFAVYYEIDQLGTASKSSINTQIKYLRDTYFSHPAYLKVDGKPVVFVYCPSGALSMVTKWASLRSTYNLYLSLTDLPNWWTKASLIDHWHGYAPAERVKAVFLGNVVYSLSVSAGFWNHEPTPRLARDYAEWAQAVATFALYNPAWELAYWNEHGEGTPIEPCVEWEGFLGSGWLTALHEAL